MGVFAWHRQQLQVERITVTHIGACSIVSLEWGPTITHHRGTSIVRVDTHTDSFLLALKADTGETVWKAERDELPLRGTPTVATTPSARCWRRLGLRVRVVRAAGVWRQEGSNHRADAIFADSVASRAALAVPSLVKPGAATDAA
jgi:hypothetical protein